MNRIKQILYWVGTTLIVIAPALYNRYPLVYFDSGAYMEMSINLEPSFHRALGYPLLMKLTGWAISNWPIVLLQGFLVSLVLYWFLEVFVKKNTRKWHFALVSIISFATGLSWYAAQLMPDIFSLILLLSTMILVFDQNLKSSRFYALLIIVFVSLLTHLSHIPWLFLMLVIWFGLSFLRQLNIPKLKSRLLIGFSTVLIAAFATVSGINAAHGLGFKMSLSSNVFITANLGEMGILKMYLEENCGSKALPFCNQIENLPIETGGYLWSADGYMAQMNQDWALANEQCAPIVHDFIFKPRYLKWLLFASVKASAKQMFQVDMGSGLNYQYAKGTPPYWPMKTHFKQELNEYLGSIQNKKDELPLSFFKYLNLTTIAISILLIGFFFLNGNINSELRIVLLFTVLAYIYHAAITGVLANVYDRLQGRIVPIIPILAFVIWLVNFLEKRRIQSED